MPKIKAVNRDLQGSHFECSNMARSRFREVNLSGAKFHDINFSNVQFTAAQIGGSKFRNIGPPTGAKGKVARPRPVTFEDATLCGSVFRNVDLSGVRIVDCNLEGMTIEGVRASELLEVYRLVKLRRLKQPRHASGPRPRRSSRHRRVQR